MSFLGGREGERERRLTSPNIIVHDRDPIENLSKSRNVRHRVSVRSSEGPDLLQRNTRNTTSSREEKSASCKKDVTWEWMRAERERART